MTPAKAKKLIEKWVGDNCEVLYHYNAVIFSLPEKDCVIHTETVKDKNGHTGIKQYTLIYCLTVYLSNKIIK